MSLSLRCSLFVVPRLVHPVSEVDILLKKGVFFQGSRWYNRHPYWLLYLDSTSLVIPKEKFL